jgi:uncharacterized protein (DUF1330 family)
MVAYVIFVRDTPIRDEAAMAEYQRLASGGMEEHRPALRVAFGEIEAFEGSAPEGVVMLEFPSMEEARAWYNSPGYQKAAPFRQKATDYRVFLVEGRF